MKLNTVLILRTKLMEVISYKVIFLLFISLPIITTEPLSCYRAKCSHCAVEFIAKTCPLVCNACPYIPPSQTFVAVSNTFLKL